VSLRYFKTTIIYSTGKQDTHEERDELNRWLDRQHEKIMAGTFRFAEAFPHASEEQKKRFAALEGHTYEYDVKKITLGEVIIKWKRDFLRTKRESRAHRLATRVDRYIVPQFGTKTFDTIMDHDVISFFKQLRHNDEKRITEFGKPLSRKVKRDLLGAFKSIWRYATNKYHWKNISNPCDSVSLSLSDEKREKGVHYTEVMDLNLPN
jgi:integrase